MKRTPYAVLQAARKLEAAHAKRVAAVARSLKAAQAAETARNAAEAAAAAEYEAFRALVAATPGHPKFFMVGDTLFRAEHLQVSAERVGVVK